MRIPTADLGGQHADAGGQACPQGAQPGAPTLWGCSLAAGASLSIALHPGRCSVQLVSCCSAAIALDKDALWVGAPISTVSSCAAVKAWDAPIPDGMATAQEQDIDAVTNAMVDWLAGRQLHHLAWCGPACAALITLAVNVADTITVCRPRGARLPQ